MLITGYMKRIQAALDQVDLAEIEAVVELLYAAYQNGQQLFVCGNGGSASLASHMAMDYGKTTSTDLVQGAQVGTAKRFRVISLVDNIPLLTAYANDVSVEGIFVEQLKNLLNPGDVLLGISGSGGSPNVLRALEYARAKGAKTIGFTGGMPKAELMRQSSDLLLAAPSTLMEQIEDLHMIFHHLITLSLRQRIFADQGQPLTINY